MNHLSNDCEFEAALVEIEILAAALAAIDKWWNLDEYESESYGFLCYQNGGTPGWDGDGGCSKYAEEEWAGYLAAHIRAERMEDA